jgi:phosphopantothenoylcysteine decarboxylase / phosphopantothenate---cysteine ligase
MNGKSVLLIVGGGIAAYKTLDLIRRLKERGVTVRTVLTDGGAHFVTELSLAALSGEPVHRDMFATDTEGRIGHIQLSRVSDLVVVAPATADLMAKMAAGLAGDLASALLLAADKKVLLAPSMNVKMWNHPATKRNVETLKRDGILFVGPAAGDLACGETGSGRMAEPAEIFAAIEAQLIEHRPLAGMKALVTAGPTHEAIDPVRYIANRSSGKQGYAIAAALALAGAETVLVSGPTDLAPPYGIKLVKVNSAREMLAACRAALPADVAIFAAAVADWRPETAADAKIKKAGAVPSFRLTENPDILAAVAQGTPRPRLTVGFAAETENLDANAAAKRTRKGCDWIVANDVSDGAVFGNDSNRVHLLTEHGVEQWPELSKREIGERLVLRIADALKGIEA